MKKVFLSLCMLLFSVPLFAQKVALKNNLLYDAAFLAPNLALEIGLGERSTLDLLGSYAWYTLGEKTSPDGSTFDKKLKHWLVQPELRFWSCERFNGFFWGIYGHGGEFNVSGVAMPFWLTYAEDTRYEGYFYGAGVSVGKQWVLGKRWNFEASVGAGWARTHYDRFECGDCGAKIESDHKDYFGPTKATLSLVYFFK
jgi:hypothetical protein